MMQTLRSMLEAILGPIDRVLASIPVEHARWFVALLLIVPLVLVFRQSRQAVLRGAPSQRAWRDLRWWALLVTLPYLALYLWVD